MISIAQNAFSVLKIDFFLLFLKILTSVVIARQLGAEVFGVWAILQLIPAYGEGLLRLKLDIASVFVAKKGNYLLGEIIFNLNLIAIVSSLLFTLPIILNFDFFYGFLFKNSGVDVRLEMYVILFQGPIVFFSMNYLYVHISREDFKTYNVMMAIDSIISSGLSVVLLLILNIKLWAVVIGLVVSKVSVLLYGIVKFFKHEKTVYKWNYNLVKELFKHGINIYISGVFNHLNQHLTSMLMTIYLLPSHIAFFGLAKSRGELLSKIPRALSVVLYPRLSKSETVKESARLSAKAFRINFIVMTTIGILSIILIKPLVLILYGQEYIAMATPLFIILPGLILSGSTNVFIQFFNGTGRSDLLPKISFLPVIVQFISAFILLPLFGLHGAAITYLIGLLTISVLQIYVFISISSCTIKDDLLLQTDDFKTITSFVFKRKN